MAHRAETGKRKVVVIMRECGGETLPFVFRSEAASISTIGAKVALGSTIYADEAASWDRLHDRFLTKRVDHQEAYSTAEACTNGAESFFSRIRRSEVGIHHHIAGPTSKPTRAKWRGAKTNAGSLMESSI